MTQILSWGLDVPQKAGWASFHNADHSSVDIIIA